MSDRQHTVALIVGSVSEPSLNRRLGDALSRLAPDVGLELTDVPIGQLPFFGAHLQSKESYPEVGRSFKRAIDGADGLLIVTPEYNRSIPGVLKNAIDWASRPDGESSFPGRPTAVIGMSEGTVSTAVAQNHVKAILSSQGAAVLGEPEAYIQYEDGLIDDEGRVAESDTEQFLREFLQSFHDLIERFADDRTPASE